MCLASNLIYHIMIKRFHYFRNQRKKWGGEIVYEAALTRLVLRLVILVYLLRNLHLVLCKMLHFNLISLKNCESYMYTNPLMS